MTRSSPNRSKRFVERLMGELADFKAYASSAEGISGSYGMLQHVDPRVKLLGLPVLILSALFARTFLAIGIVFIIAVLLSIRSNIEVGALLRWVWRPVLIFTGCIALPAIFTTAGDSVVQIPVLGWHVTFQGLRSAGFLILRAQSAATLSAALVLTTPWPRILKALRVFRVPILFVVILGFTYRYIFLLLETASDMAEARRARTVGFLEPGVRRRIGTASVGVLLSKSLQLGNEVHLAMLSRGFRGEVYLLDEFETGMQDWIWTGIFLGMAGFVFWVGR